MLKSKEMVASELRRLNKFNHNVVKAARAGNIQDMEENLKEGDINFQDNYGWTSLMWATYRGNLDCVEAPTFISRVFELLLILLALLFVQDRS